VAIEDVAMVHAYRGCPETVTYLTHPALDLERTRQRLARAAVLWQSADRERFNLTFAVLLDGTLIGDVHAWNMAEQFQPASPDPAEVWIGYAFSPRNHGHGYATEPMWSLLDWLFVQGAVRVFANSYTDNRRRITVMHHSRGLDLDRHGLAASRVSTQPGCHAATTFRRGWLVASPTGILPLARHTQTLRRSPTRSWQEG